jgi:hypothetical protein
MRSPWTKSFNALAQSSKPTGGNKKMVTNGTTWSIDEEDDGTNLTAEQWAKIELDIDVIALECSGDAEFAPEFTFFTDGNDA